MGHATCRLVTAGVRLLFICTLSLLPGLPDSDANAETTPLIHSSQTIGSTKYGTWGADYTCATCHTRSSTPNIKKVPPQIMTPTGLRPVLFERITASGNDIPGVMGNDERTYDVDASRNVCEVCHHRTIYHTYSASKLSNRLHPEHKSNNRDCNTCHKHRYGYRPPDTKACVDCHATPPTSPDGMVSNALGPSPPPDAGAHNRHRNIEGMECHTCHNNYAHGYQGNDVIEFGFRIDRRTWSGFSGISSVMSGTVTGTSNPLFNNRYAVAPGNPGTTLVLTNDWVLTCSVYCHGDGWVVPSGKQGGAVSWTQGPLGSCDTSSCHGTTPSSPPNPGVPGAHTRHVGDLSMACTRCHDDYPNPHMVNGRVKWNLSGQGENAAYKGFRIHSTSHLPGLEPYGDCTNIYCHSNVQPEGGVGSPTLYRSVRWGAATVIGCDGCHAGRPGDGTEIGTGSHTKHLSAGYVCGECHRGGGADGPLMTHLDENIQVAFGVFSGAYSQMPLNRPGDGYGSCSANYCHSDGVGGYRSVAWGANGTVGCSSCHRGGESSDPISTGKHAQHVTIASPYGSGIPCIGCHAATVSSDTTLLPQGTRHLNRFADYSGTLAGRMGGGSCTSYCHTDGKGGTPAVAVGWNDTSHIDDCRGCHGGAVPAGFTSVAGEPNYPNSPQPGTLRSNSHQTHTTKLTWSGSSSCDVCHAATVVPGGGGVAAAGNHLNRVIDVSFNQAKAGNGSYDPLSRRCSNTLCHGTLTPVWGDSAGGGCPTCHPALSGVHARHVGDLMAGSVTFYGYTANRSTGSVYRFGCATCHPLTEAGNHRNGTIDIDLSSTASGIGRMRQLNAMITAAGTGFEREGGSLTCTLVYCHSDGRGSTPVYRSSPDWYGSFSGNRCGMCHDNPPQYSGQSHHVAQSSLGNNGRPPYREAGHMVGIHFRFIARGGVESGFLGFSSSGRVAHGNPSVATTISCALCHSGIVSSTRIDTYAMDGTASLYRCGSCHTGSTRTPLQSGEIVDTARHPNGAKEVVFAPIEFRTTAQLSNVANALGWSRSGDYKSGSSYDGFLLSSSTWDPQTRSCLTACHVNQPGITWGGAIQCSSCHANQ